MIAVYYHRANVFSKRAMVSVQFISNIGTLEIVMGNCRFLYYVLMIVSMKPPVDEIQDF